MVNVKKNDFVELNYTGYSNGEVFDSNVEEDLRKINPTEKPKQLIVVVGQKMIVPGFDSALEGKEIGKEYSVDVKPKEGFGDRRRDLVKIIPLKLFTDKQIRPYPGLTLALDDMLARVITVSGARVVTDFNNPLAGKDLTYKFKIIRKVEDEKEKVKSLFENLLGFAPDFEVNEKVILKGPKEFNAVIKMLGTKFKDILGKEMELKIVEEKKDAKENKEGKDDNKEELHNHSHEDEHHHSHDGHEHNH